MDAMVDAASSSRGTLAASPQERREGRRKRQSRRGDQHDRTKV